MCIFCAISEGKIPSKKILENDKFLAFYDINPQTKIHALVIPKEHFKDFNDVSSVIMAEMTTFIQDVVSALNIKSSGYRMISNTGVDGGQEVPHLHFHILAGEKLGKLV